MLTINALSLLTCIELSDKRTFQNDKYLHKQGHVYVLTVTRLLSQL
jgi:hypothetical protein